MCGARVLRYTAVEGLSRARETATTGSAAVDRQRRSTNCDFLRLGKPVPHRTPLERKPRSRGTSHGFSQASVDANEPPPPHIRRQGQSPLRGPRAGNPHPAFQGRRDRLQRQETRDHRRQGRPQQPHLRICVSEPECYRRADAFHSPAQHARAVDPRGRDHPARSRRAQCRRRLAGQAPRHRGRHAAAALHHRVLLQERRARRSDGLRGAHHRLRLGQPAGNRRHHGARPSASTTSCPACSSASASASSTSRWNAAGFGKAR